MGDLKQNQPPQHEAAGRIADILLHFGDRFYSETSDSPQFTLRDILTDLRHYADVYGLEFGRALEGSGEVYDVEREDDSQAEVAPGDFSCPYCGREYGLLDADVQELIATTGKCFEDCPGKPALSCEGCDGSGIRETDDANGVLPRPGYTFIERCDLCEKFTTDEQAAEAYGMPWATTTDGNIEAELKQKGSR